MDSSGRIVDLDALKISDREAEAMALTKIPPGLVSRVTFLTTEQRRRWRELVRAGEAPEVALLRAQDPTRAR
jgi:hypothetical protein